MPVSAFTKFNQFAEDLGLKVHNLDTDTLKVYLSNATPSVSADAVKADLAEISSGNGYTAGGHDTQNTYTETGGVGSCVGVDITITAAGGSIGPFQYVVLYNDTPTSPADPLIGWWDYGSALTLTDTQFITIDFGSSMFTVT